MSRRIVLDELDRVGVVEQLDDETAAALQRSGLVEVRPDSSGFWRLLPAERIGAVAVDDVDVVVRPKTTMASLLFILGYASDPGFQPGLVEGIPDDDLWAALAETLARQAEHALGRGVLQGYVSVEEALPLVRGRILLADQVARRPGFVIPIEARYDEYTSDIAENRILRGAVRRMLAVPRVRDDARRRLTHVDGQLAAAALLPAGAPLPTWRPNRLNQRYHAVLRLAETILAAHGPTINPGNASMAAFVINMAKAFEDFVTVALCEALSDRPGRTVAQYPTHLDTVKQGSKSAYPMYPDVVYEMAYQPCAVFDAKYKLESPSGRYPNADAYQMLAYCTALSLRAGWLVYARGRGAAAEHRVRHTDIDIVEYPLDLLRTPTELLAQVRTLAQQAVPTDMTAAA